MENFDARVDSYIEQSADFAKPILTYIRNIVHLSSPKITETIKWGFPHFEYKGTICSMASFKSHCAFGFWKASLLTDPHKVLSATSSDAMGHFGRVTSLNDLPADDILIALILEAMDLNEKGIKVQKKKAANSDLPVEIPDYFVDVLMSHPAAMVNFEKFSKSHRKEYIMWFEEAKTEQTRNKRIAQAIEWLSNGKSRNWKYERK